MPNPLDTLYDQLKGQYPDLVDRSEFIGKLSNEDELKKLHDAASKDIPGFVDFDNFKSKVGESLSTYDQDSDYKAQSAPAEQESAPTDITIPRREKGRHVPSKPQNGDISSEAYVPVQPGQPTDTHLDAEPFDRETGDLDELDRRYQEKVKRLEGYGADQGLYVNEDEARKHYEAYSRLYDEAEQDRLVYNRRVKAAEDERAEQQRQLDLQSKDRKTRRSAEYGGYTNDQVRKEQERLKKERAYLEDPKSRRNADYSRRVMEYNADQSALSGEADKRNKSYERKRAMYDEVRKVAEDPDVQKRITGNDTVTYVLSGNNTYALQNYDTAMKRAKTMSDEELVEHCKTIAGQKYARGDNKDIYAPLAAAFMAYHNELMYRLGGDEPKSALEMRYDMIDKATESSPEGDNFMLTLRNYLDGTSGMGTANFENDPSERANIPQFAVVDYFNNLLAQKEAENRENVERIAHSPDADDFKGMEMARAALDINYDDILQQAFDQFGDINFKAYITAHSLRNGISTNESARRVYQSIWDETIGKVMDESRPKSNLEFFMRRITSDNMFAKLWQIGLRAQNGTLGSTDPFMVNSTVLDEYAKDHPVLETGAAVFNFAVMEGPIFSAYGKLAGGLVGATERAIIGAATKTADKMAIDATAKALSQSLMYRLAKGVPIGGLVGFQYGTMSGAIDQAYYDGNVNFGKVIANCLHMGRDFAIMHGEGEVFGVTGDAILRRGQRAIRNGQNVLRNRLETASLDFLNNVAKTTTNAAIVTGLYAAIDKPALERENKKIAAENARLPEDQRKPLNQIASVEDTFYSSLRMFAGLDAVGAIRRAWSIGVRGQYERNKHVKVHFDKFDREALEKAFGKNPNSLLRQIVFGNVDGVPSKWFEIDPEAEAEIYKELGRELTPAEKEAYATYGFTELRKVILNKDIPWATRAKIVSVVTGRIVQEPPVARATIDFVMDKSGTVAKRIIVKSLDLEVNVIQAREFDGQREFEAARSLYESLNDRGWRNNALLCGNLVIDAIEDKTYADTVDEMAREKGIAPDQFEQMVFGIKQKDITGEKVTYQERRLVDEFDKRHQQMQKAETELAGPNKLFEQVAREVFGAEWKRALNIPSKSWGEMSEAEKEFVNRYIDRIGAMGVAERNKLMNANPDWTRTAKEYEESVRRRMAEAERPAEAEPLPVLEDEKVSVEVPAEERVEPVPEIIELEEEPGKEQPTQSAGPQDTPTPVEDRPAEPAKPVEEEKPQAGTIGFEPVEQPTERERRGEEELVAEPVTPDDSANEFVAHEDDVAPFSLLSLNYRQGEVEGGTIRSRARTRKQIGTIAKALGYKIRWIADKPYNAKIDTDEKVLYLNIRTDMPLEAVMGHEVTHDLRKSDPKAYETLKRYAQDLLGQEQWDSEVKDVTDDYNEEYERRGWEPIRADKAEEEVVCDTMGKVLHTKKGLRELAGSLDTTVAGKVYRLLKDITDKVKNALVKEHDYSTMDIALRDFLNAVEQRAKKGMPIQDAPVEDASVDFSLRRKPAPKNTGVGYKVFFLKDGKLYPPMVANIGGEATPFGVWLDADAAPIAGKSKTGRNKVKAGGKGTQGGSGTLAYRPGWHLGKIPYALQFNRGKKVPNPLGILNKKGQVIEVGEFFPNDFVWAEVEYAADKDYQEEAHGYGVNANGKYNPSLAGLPRVPEDGSYEYRTNPNPATDPWIITGAMKVNKILKPSEVDEMVRAAGREPQKRQEGAFTDEQIDTLNKQLNNTIGNTARNIQGLEGYTEQDVLDGVRGDIDAKLEDAGVDGVTIKGMALHGSRMRGDARADSDLDVVVEYEGDISEDGLFNILNDEPMHFDGVKVDINPITRGKSGTLEQYMERSRRYDEEKLRDESSQSGTSFSIKREGRDEDKVPTFYSNAAKAVEGVKQNKATAEQWKAMLTKAGGIKAGEDKWMGLSQWLDEHKGETLTKEQVRQFVAENGVQMEEVGYSEAPDTFESLKQEYDQWLHDEGFDYAQEQLRERFGDDADIAFDDLGGELVVANEEAAAAVLGSENIINSTRLDYTTEGLENKREIAFVVPDVEPYQEGDEVHFGPENQGRAVMWVRFGETTDTEGNRVLVIDEIQSNRHQDGREKGYEDPALTERLKQIQQEIDAATKEFGDFNDTLRQKYGFSTNYTKIEKTREEWGWNHRLVPNEDVLTKEEVQKWKEGDEKIKALKDVKDKLLVDRMWQEGVPAAPFEKNWHEVAMKRMLRLAAEEGFDKVAWTTGGQQAERYDIGNAVERIEKLDDRAFLVYPKDGSAYQELEFDEDGVYRDDDDALLNNKTMADIFGKETAEKLKNLSDGDQLTGEGLRIGGEGMKGFYDQMLPRFMDKYGKRWGVKTGEVTLNTPGKETMHSVDVTPEMRRSVMEQGQPLFSLKREDSQKVFDTAKRKFGETKDIREAGYVLPDGSMLDFSGRHELDPGTDSSFLAGRRETDHRAINQISFVYDENGDEVDTGVTSDMPDFIKRGAIRIDNNAGSINLSAAPTMAQRRVLRELIRRNGGDVQVDFGDGWNSDHYVEYEEASAQRVLGDIDRYFDEGIKPEGNVRFSLKKETRTDADGNEVYTETREDGTKDREITTYSDGSKKAQGYDGFIRTDEDGNILEYGVFDSNQVKSATGNNGDFDPNNPDIRFSLKRRRNRDDYTDEDRADAAIIANTYLAQADALRQQIEADREREHQLVEERNRLLAFDYPAADPADRPAIMDRINALRNQINDLRNANYENNTKLRSMDYEYRVAKEILEQGAVTDEEAEHFDAGQMTREEKVLESLFKAAADSRADKKAKQKAIRGLVRELVAITDNFKAAMKARGIESQRKHYDKGTVDHIIRLAKAMMNTGYIDNMTSYEVKRLMGMINNAATRESIETQAGRIVDMMLDHQIRTLRNDFNKQLKVTGQKTNSSGVQVQAGLDQEGQVVMEAMRKSMQIIADSAGERYDSNGYLTEWGEFYEKTLNDMGDADPVKAEQARKIFEGVWLASKWYEDVRTMEINDRILRSQMEDFKASNKPARDADADTKKRYNDVLADYQEMLRQNKIKIIEAYERMTGDVGLTQADSMRRAKEFADAQKRRVEEIQHNANSDLADVDDNTQVETPESRVFGANKNNVLARLLFASAGTYEKFMRFFGRMAPNGEGYLFKRFMTQYHHARQNYWKGRHSAFEEMDRKMAEVFGKKKMHWSDIYEMTRDHKKFPPITVSYWDGYRNGQPFMRMDELNQSEALYLYMINKMPDGRMKLRHMGITDDVVQQMAGQIDGRLIQLAEWLQGEFLPKMRVKYNETHKRVFGADMAAIEDYFPLRVNKLSVASDMDITERDMNDNKPSTITGAIVKRRVNTLPIDLHTDAFDVALSHIDEMEHWSAYAEFNRDNNTLVNYKRFRTKVNNMRSLELGAGNVLWKNFTDAVAIATDAYHPAAGSRSGDHYATRVAKFVSTAKIALRPYTALKQLLSIPAFWADSDPLEQMKATVNVANTWQWAIENLPGFAERWQSRQAGNIKLANYNDLSGLRRRKAMQILGRAGMWANAAIDGLACAMGGKAVYETKLKRYRKMGYDEARAQEKALIDAAIAYNNSQQSSEGAYVSPLQVDRTWFANAFSVFRSASMGYTRRLNTSLRQLRNATFKPGYGAKSVEFLKKQMMRDGLTEEQAEKLARRIYRRTNLKAAASVAIFGQILPFTWNLGANMFYLLFGDDDKEKEDILADSFRHSFFGPVEGLTGGNVISELGDIAADTAIGNIWGGSVWGDSEAYKTLGYRDFSTMPLSSDLSSLLRYFARDEVKAANEVVNILFQVATGVNPQTITDWATAILDFGRSDMERRDIAMFVMRMLSTPQSQLDKFYLDQMNLTQEQADKMSVDDLIKRYATYKRWRETPLTGWMYSDEREKKVEEKFQKRYEEMLEERSVAEEGLRGTINKMEDLPRKRTMMDKLQKELTDSIEAADPELYKKALEGEKADDDEYVRHVTDKDVEQMAELAMKKKALYAAHERKKQADKDRVAGRINKEEYDAIYKECAHQWKLYNYLNGEFPKDIKEMKLKMEPGASEHNPEYWMDSIRTLTDEALRMRPEDMKMKKADRKHYRKKNKNK